MKVLENLNISSSLIIIEPGDCTRYEFIVSKFGDSFVLAHVNGNQEAIVFNELDIMHFLKEHEDYSRADIGHWPLAMRSKDRQ